MSKRNISFAPNEYYHIYNRGTDKRVIFKDTADYSRFMQLLYLSNSTQLINVRDIQKEQKEVFDFNRVETLVDIGVYCLMPNHFHILIKEKKDGGISHFMNKLGTSYSMYFNKRYERNGSLFQGRYKAEWANSDQYLKYLFSYIHLNPVKIIDPHWKENGVNNTEAILEYLYNYKYSSFIDFSLGLAWGEGRRPESRILSVKNFPEYFPTGDLFKREIFEWIDFSESP